MPRRSPALQLAAAASLFAAAACSGGLRPSVHAFVVPRAATVGTAGYPPAADSAQWRAMRRDNPVFRAHDVTEGEGTVLALRVYHGGSPFAYDDEWVEMLTVTLPGRLARSGTVELGAGDAAAVWLAGSHVWRIAGCNGPARGGTLRWRRDPFGFVHATIEARLDVRGPRGSSCPATLRRSVVFRPGTVPQANGY
jgi:hypothetical protein